MTDDTIGSAFKTALFQMVAERRLTADGALEMVRRLETAVPELDLVKRAHPRKVEGIAVVGMAGRFAQAPDLSSFWSMIREGRDGVIELPEQRRVGGAVERGGFLPDHDLFDPLFFKISPTEAALMDPQQRIFLEQAYAAFEDAGYAEPDLSGLRCGVFVGAGSGDYSRQLDGVGQGAGPQALMGNVASILSARISYFLNLRGPSLAIDTACSSSLVAVHLACEALRSGSCEMALAGGVCVVSTTLFLTAMREAGMLSPSAACHTFDADADGFVIGEGAGAVILKPLERALADGDHIYGVIRGSAINQDGRTNGITAPSAPSQTALEREVYEAAGIDPGSIGYIEAHGTGTPLGDPIEIEALTSAFRQWTDRNGFCGIGSVKTNIGHALTAAGIAGLIKVLLMLRHGRIPPSLHFNASNPRIDFASTPFFVADQPRPWARLDDSPRRAAVSSFGFSGTNAHLLVEEAPATPARAAASGPFVFPVSARSQAALERRCRELAQALTAAPQPDLCDVAHTLTVGRTHWPHRAAFVASERDELVRQLLARAEGRADPESRGGSPELLARTNAFVRGETIDWRSLIGSLGGRRVPLPHHGFDRQRYGVQPVPASRPDALAAVAEAVRDIQETAGAGLEDLGHAFGGVEAWGRKAAAIALAPLLPNDRRAMTREALLRHLGVVDEARGLWSAILDLLARDGIVGIEGDLVRLPGELAIAAVDLDDERQKLVAEEPAVAPFIELLERTTAALPKVLRGEIKGTEALFPEGRFDLVERVYRGNRLADYFNRVMAAAVAAAAPADRELRVLEIGAGTGGATAGILDALAATGCRVAYDYTDVSLGFTQLGRSRFAADYPFVGFRTLDIERDPLEQGFEQHAYDVVVASNVLHATRDIGATLARVATLTRSGGLVLVNEVTALQDFASLTFGLTEGWWAFEDGERRLRHAPLLDVAEWRRSLTEAGFGACRALGLPGEPEEKAGQAVIVAERAVVAQPASRPAPSPSKAAEPAPIAAIDAAPAAPGGDLETLLRREVASILTMAEAAIDPRGRFMDYGVDSILGLQLVGRLNSLLGTDLRPTVLFDHPTVLDLARHLKTLPGVRLPVVDSLPTAPAAKRTQPATTATPSDRQIAVIGMAGRFASTDNLAEFHRLLAEGRSGIGDLSARWGIDLDEVERERGIDARYLRWGGGLRRVDLFDPLFFRISGKEAELTDPQHRILLTEAWRALEDAGYGEPALDGARCGIFIGCHGGDYTHRMAEVGIVPEAFAFMGNAASILAARIAYILNLKGPSLAVDTACSSSLVAVHLACQSLLAGECDMAMAGGVFINTTIGFNAAASKAGMLSSEGRCKTFDADADGFVPGEGAGVVVLKPLAQALEDGDHVEAVILASAVNQDGRTNGITAPSMQSQTRLELEVYEKAGIDPSTIGYVEAHGTGTRLGDPIEIEGLTRAFRRYGEGRQLCPIGSVKTNVGHAAHAAGIAGLLKVLLQFRHSELYPSLNFRTPNPDLHLEESPFHVLTERRPWPRGERARLAAISSFGFSGTNVHMVLSEAPDLPETPADEGSWRLIPVSAKTPTALRQRLGDLRGWLDRNDPALGDVSHTLAWGRSHFGDRWAAIVRSHAQLVALLDRALASPGDELPRLTEPVLPDDTDAAPPGRLAELAKQYLAGAEPDFRDLNPGARRCSLPTYPFEEQSYWITPLPEASPRVSLFAPTWDPRPLPRATSPAPRAIRLLGADRVPGLAGRLRAAGHRVEEGAGPSGAGAPDLSVDLRALGDAGGGLRPLYDLVRTEMRRGGAVLPPILFVHDGRPMSEAAAAFTPSLASLDRRLRLVPIRLETPLPSAAALAEMLLVEAAAIGTGSAKEVGYADGVRHGRRLRADDPQDRHATGGWRVAHYRWRRLSRAHPRAPPRRAPWCARGARRPLAPRGRRRRDCRLARPCCALLDGGRHRS